MEDDKRLDLSLGLPVGRSSSKSNDKSSTSVNPNPNGGDRTNKILNDFRNFLNGGVPQQPQGDKRKSVYEETSSQKRQETERSSELLEKGRASHISITTDDGSTADNEDVAESEAETVNKDAVSVNATAASFNPVSSERTHTMNVGNTPITFGYSSGQLPFLDKDNPWAGRPQFNPYPARPLSASGTSHGQSDAKQPVVEEESTAMVTLTENSFPSEYPAIRPGMAADLKFGGSGSLPNLPWVSTTGPGPNGRTISGVTYRFSANQIKIVCACHGLHMSPEDFIHHASDEPPSAADSTAAGSSTGGSGGGGGGGGGAASAKS